MLIQHWNSLCYSHARTLSQQGGGPRVVVSTAAFHARVRGSVPGLGGLKETKLFLPHPRVKVSIVGSLRDREVACSASDRQGSNFESCVWRTVSSQSSHHPQEVLLAQLSLYVHKGGLKPDSFHFILLSQQTRRLSNIVRKLYKCFVFAGILYIYCDLNNHVQYMGNNIILANFKASWIYDITPPFHNTDMLIKLFKSVDWWERSARPYLA